jgi:YD repeat-containing protein
MTAQQKTLKNTYSQSTRIFDDIQRVLREHRARQLSFDYDDAGRIVAIAFTLDIDGRFLSFRLPARIEAVERIFLQQKQETAVRYVDELTVTQREQAYRTCWANVRDWLSAQMAMVDMQQAEVEEIFLPYMLVADGKTTYFEVLRERHFLLAAHKVSISEE